MGYRYDDGSATTHSARKGAVYTVTPIPEDYEKIAFYEIGDYFKNFEIGEKKISGSPNISAYHASLILLFLNAENRKAFLEYYPESIKRIQLEIKASADLNNSKETKNKSNKELSADTINKIKSAVLEHNNGFSKCYAKPVEIIDIPVQVLDEETKKANEEKAEQIREIKRYAAVLSNDRLRRLFLRNMVYAIGKAYERYNIKSVNIDAYTELVPKSSKKGFREYNTEGIKVRLHLSTDGAPSKVPFDVDLTPMYMARVAAIAASKENKTK